MAVGEELWVGLGNGQVLIFDVIRNDAYEDEAYVVLNENKGENLFFFPVKPVFDKRTLRGTFISEENETDLITQACCHDNMSDDR